MLADYCVKRQMLNKITRIIDAIANNRIAKQLVVNFVENVDTMTARNYLKLPVKHRKVP